MCVHTDTCVLYMVASGVERRDGVWLTRDRRSAGTRMRLAQAYRPAC